MNNNIRSNWSAAAARAHFEPAQHADWSYDQSRTAKPLRTRRKTARKVAVKPAPKKTGSTNPYNFTPQRKLQGAPDTARPVRNITW